MADFNELVNSLNLTSVQNETLMYLYQKVGETVSDLLNESDVLSADFTPYNIVGVAVERVLEEHKTSKEYSILEPVLDSNFAKVEEILTHGYGTPEEIFNDYKEILDGF